MASSVKGVALLTVLKPTYGKFAFNLLTSIKVQNPGLKVQVFHDSQGLKHLADWQLEAFDIRTEIPDELLSFNGRLQPGRVKAFLYDKFAFDNVIFLDADSLLLKPLEFNFKKPFLSLTSPTNYWLSDENYHKHFQLDKAAKVPATNTSFMWIKKGAKTKKLFEDWQNNFENPIKAEDIPENGEWFNGLMPDEPYLNAALAMNKINPKMEEEPLFCQWKFDAMPELSSITAKGISFWGHPTNIHHSLMKWYDRIMINYMKEIWGSNQIYSSSVLVKRKAVE